jgi:hypothetical protein
VRIARGECRLELDHYLEILSAARRAARLDRAGPGPRLGGLLRAGGIGEGPTDLTGLITSRPDPSATADHREAGDERPVVARMNLVSPGAEEGTSRDAGGAALDEHSIPLRIPHLVATALLLLKAANLTIL